MNDQKIDCQRAEVPGEKGFVGGGIERSRRGDECGGRPLGRGGERSGDGLPAPL